MFREQRPHLRVRLDVALLTHEAEPVGIVQILPHPDGEQHVVGLGVLAAEIVGIVGGHHRQAQVRGEAEHPLRDDVLVRDAVALHLEPEAIGSEHLSEPLRGRFRLLVAPLAQVQRDLAGETGGEADDPFLVALQCLAVDAGPPIVTLEEADGRQFDEVRVALAIGSEEHEVRVVARGAGKLLPAMPAAERYVSLEAEDGAELPGLGLLVEPPRAVEVAVVREGDRVHPQRLDAREQVRNAVGAVEEGILAVGVKVNERHLAYRGRARRSSSSNTLSSCRRFASSNTTR